MMKQAYDVYDLTWDRDLKRIRISNPGKLETDLDVRLMFHYYISYYCPLINIIRLKYGYEARQRTLALMLLFLQFARETGIPYDVIDGALGMLLIECRNEWKKMQEDSMQEAVN